MKLTFDEMYAAIGKNGSIYEGLFITAVKSTHIFCRPSCRARKPLAKNVTFYSTPQEALQHGYRPCKICRPMENDGETPCYIKDLIKQIHQEPFKKIKDWDLKQMGLEPSHIRRWFKANHKMTFHGYQRLIRLNMGYTQIQKGETVTNAAFDSGYESLSGFNDGFKTIFGTAPTKNEQTKVIYIDRFSTVLGPMFVCATDLGICLLEFTDRKMLETEFKDLRKRLKAAIVPGRNSHIQQLKKELKGYFAGKRLEFSVALDPQGTDFQKQVWEELIKIPYGETRSYKQQAARLKNVKAVRAVAHANGMNKIAIVIPCHRVIGSDGSLTGYAGGLPRKKWLLEHETKNS